MVNMRHAAKFMNKNQLNSQKNKSLKVIIHDIEHYILYYNIYSLSPADPTYILFIKLFLLLLWTLCTGRDSFHISSLFGVNRKKEKDRAVKPRPHCLIDRWSGQSVWVHLHLSVPLAAYFLCPFCVFYLQIGPYAVYSSSCQSKLQLSTFIFPLCPFRGRSVRSPRVSPPPPTDHTGVREPGGETELHGHKARRRERGRRLSGLLCDQHASRWVGSQRGSI